MDSLFGIIVFFVLVFVGYWITAAADKFSRLAFRYWWARARSGYGPIRLQLLTEGTLVVSVFKGGKWIPVIAEFRDTSGGTIDHSVSEIEIQSLINRPYYFEEERDPGRYKRRSRVTRRRNP